MITAIVIWLGLQIPLAIVVGKFLKVGTEPGLIADGLQANSTDGEVQAVSTDDRSLKKAA